MELLTTSKSYLSQKKQKQKNNSSGLSRGSTHREANNKSIPHHFVMFFKIEHALNMCTSGHK